MGVSPTKCLALETLYWFRELPRALPYTLEKHGVFLQNLKKTTQSRPSDLPCLQATYILYDKTKWVVFKGLHAVGWVFLLVHKGLPHTAKPYQYIYYRACRMQASLIQTNQQDVQPLCAQVRQKEQAVSALCLPNQEAPNPPMQLPDSTHQRDYAALLTYQKNLLQIRSEILAGKPISNFSDQSMDPEIPEYQAFLLAIATQYPSKTPQVWLQELDVYLNSIETTLIPLEKVWKEFLVAIHKTAWETFQLLQHQEQELSNRLKLTASSPSPAVSTPPPAAVAASSVAIATASSSSPPPVFSTELDGDVLSLQTQLRLNYESFMKRDKSIRSSCKKGCLSPNLVKEIKEAIDAGRAFIEISCKLQTLHKPSSETYSDITKSLADLEQFYQVLTVPQMEKSKPTPPLFEQWNSRSTLILELETHITRFQTISRTFCRFLQNPIVPKDPLPQEQLLEYRELATLVGTTIPTEIRFVQVGLTNMQRVIANNHPEPESLLFTMQTSVEERLRSLEQRKAQFETLNLPVLQAIEQVLATFTFNCNGMQSAWSTFLNNLLTLFENVELPLEDLQKMIQVARDNEQVMQKLSPICAFHCTKIELIDAYLIPAEIESKKQQAKNHPLFVQDGFSPPVLSMRQKQLQAIQGCLSNWLQPHQDIQTWFAKWDRKLPELSSESSNSTAATSASLSLEEIEAFQREEELIQEHLSSLEQRRPPPPLPSLAPSSSKPDIVQQVLSMNMQQALKFLSEKPSRIQELPETMQRPIQVLLSNSHHVTIFLTHSMVRSYAQLSLREAVPALSRYSSLLGHVANASITPALVTLIQELNKPQYLQVQQQVPVQARIPPLSVEEFLNMTMEEAFVALQKNPQRIATLPQNLQTSVVGLFLNNSQFAQFVNSQNKLKQPVNDVLFLLAPTNPLFYPLAEYCVPPWMHQHKQGISDQVLPLQEHKTELTRRFHVAALQSLQTILDGNDPNILNDSRTCQYIIAIVTACQNGHSAELASQFPAQKAQLLQWLTPYQEAPSTLQNAPQRRLLALLNDEAE